MPDLLLELRSEEIPARMQAKAREDLARLLAAELAKAGIAAAETVTYATPRRLALIARGLPLQTEAVREETKGPKASAPAQALEGFLRKTGLTREQLEERDGVFFAVVEKPGRATLDVLAAAIPAIVRAFPWPKSMRWGAASVSTESPRWVRPLSGIVAMLDEAVVPCEVAGVVAGAATIGHRFHHPGSITLAGAADYVEKLRTCHVVVDPAEREAIIATGATMLSAKAGLTLIRDEGLLAENAGLTEWPVPLLGRFDPAFLDVPPEVIQLTARVNQKYFVCQDGAGKLANAFICVANVDAEDGGERIVAGNAKVLAARLSDARFFFEQDLKIALEDQARKLEKIVFHEKLGTISDRVKRVAQLAQGLVAQGIVPVAENLSSSSLTILPVTPMKAGASGEGAVQEPQARQEPLGAPASAGATHLAKMAYDAARLAKADLVTGMVGEFPELQGVMGGYYAAKQGEPPEVSAAIRDNYKPVGHGDEVPTSPITVALNIADNFDMIASFFAIKEYPTGSKDPYALRRAALKIISLLRTNQVRFSRERLGYVLEVYFQNLSTDIELTLEKEEKRLLTLSRSEEVRFLEENRGSLSEQELRESGWSVRRHYERLSAEMLTEIAEITRRCNDFSEVHADIVRFLIDRLKVQQREAGVRHDLIDAVFALGGEDDLVRLLARVRALQAFVTTEDGANLLAGYKRAANILKKEGWPDTAPANAEAAEIPQTGEEDPLVEVTDPAFKPAVAAFVRSEQAYAPEPAEDALLLALNAAAPRAEAAIHREDFEGAMAALATLRAPIDAFFDTVTVNDPDPAKRTARLSLLARMRDAVHQVADFSRIEG